MVSPMNSDPRSYACVVCVHNDGYPVSLEVRKIYRALPNRAARSDYLRVVDESGADYLYPREYFIALDLSDAVTDALFAEAS